MQIKTYYEIAQAQITRTLAHQQSQQNSVTINCSVYHASFLNLGLFMFYLN